MRKRKYLFVFCMLLAITLAGGIFTGAYIRLEDRQEEGHKLHIVTSFYPVYIAALNVVGDNTDVELENLSEPQTGCMHDYQLTPKDMILLSGADLFLVNGGGIENFLTEVSEAYPSLNIYQAAQELELLTGGDGHGHDEKQHNHSEENAHAWIDTRLYAKMVQNIAAALMEADPANQTVYQKNADHYCAKIQKLTDQFAELKETTAGQPAVIFHEAYAYLAKELGMQPVYCLNLDEERQVSARETADVLEEITEHQISIVFAEELYGKDLGNTVQEETDAEVCYLDTLVRGDYKADSYLNMAQKKIDLLKQAFKKK